MFKWRSTFHFSDSQSNCSIFSTLGRQQMLVRREKLHNILTENSDRWPVTILASSWNKSASWKEHIWWLHYSIFITNLIKLQRQHKSAKWDLVADWLVTDIAQLSKLLLRQTVWDLEQVLHRQLTIAWSLDIVVLIQCAIVIIQMQLYITLYVHITDLNDRSYVTPSHI